MDGRSFAAAVATVLGLTLAGCSEPDAGTTGRSLDADLDFGGGSAILRGQVTDTELQPVAGALVAIGDFSPLKTDAAGEFEAVGLASGAYVVHVAALGHEGASRQVQVDGGDVIELTFTLERVPVEEPYLDLLMFRGYSVCILVWWVDVTSLPCADDPNAKNWVIYNVTESWRFMVVEVEFSSGQIGGYDNFRLFTAPADPGGDDCASGDPCYGQIYGRDYARIEGEPGKTEIVKHYDPWVDERGPPYPEGPFDVQVNAQWIGYLQDELGYGSPPGEACRVIIDNAAGAHKYGCLGVGVSTGITFDLYTSVFHWHKPPLGACCPASDYTALPDR